MPNTYKSDDNQEELKDICIRYAIEASNYSISCCKHCTGYHWYSVVNIKNYHQWRTCNIHTVISVQKHLEFFLLAKLATCSYMQTCRHTGMLKILEAYMPSLCQTAQCFYCPQNSPSSISLVLFSLFTLQLNILCYLWLHVFIQSVWMVSPSLPMVNSLFNNTCDLLYFFTHMPIFIFNVI